MTNWAKPVVPVPRGPTFH